MSARAAGQASRPEISDRSEAWFRGLYAADMRAVLGYALRRVSARGDAADVVADTFLVAWRRRADVPDDADEARAWLIGTARRVLANHHRGEERRARLAERLRAELDATPEVYASGPDTGRVRAALAALSDGDRELVTLVAWEGLTPQQVAIATGLPAGTVRTRLHRARKRLAAEMSATEL